MSLHTKTPADGLRDAQSALRGECPNEDLRKLDIAKMVCVMLSPEDADVRVDSHGFFVHYPHRAQAFSYYPALTGPSLDWILGATDLKRPVCERQRGVLFVPSLPRHSLFRVLNSSPRTIWVIPEPTAVHLRLRMGRHTDCQDIEPWRPPVKVWVELTGSLACPHCKAESREYREVEDRLVCQSCGRSFPNLLPPEDIARRGSALASAGLHTDGVIPPFRSVEPRPRTPRR